MNLFRSEEHIDGGSTARAGSDDPGDEARRAREEWWATGSRPTGGRTRREQNQAILDRLGLTGGFWAAQVNVSYTGGARGQARAASASS
jgi:hypothetical protein